MSKDACLGNKISSFDKNIGRVDQAGLLEGYKRPGLQGALNMGQAKEPGTHLYNE